MPSEKPRNEQTRQRINNKKLLRKTLVSNKDLVNMKKKMRIKDCTSHLWKQS